MAYASPSLIDLERRVKRMPFFFYHPHKCSLKNQRL
nr:MAG TPA: hypothetical protein [Caudoviricetes sp.]